MHKKLIVFTKVLLDFLFYTGIIVTVFVPFIIIKYGTKTVTIIPV